MRDRIPQLLEERRIYRSALRVHGDAEGTEMPRRQRRSFPLHPLWNRRFSTKFNGVSYVTQRGAEALYSEEGKRRCPLWFPTTWKMPGFFARRSPQRTGCLRWRERSLHLGARPGGVTSWEIFDRLLRATPHRRHAGQRFWDVRRRLLPHLRIQQPRQRRRGRTKILRHKVVVALSLG